MKGASAERARCWEHPRTDRSGDAGGETISSCRRAVSCGERLRFTASAAQAIKQTAELHGIRIRQFRANMLFDRRGIGAPHFLLQLAPGLGNLPKLPALVDLALAPPHRAFSPHP